ncbi:EPIDERMAL PATTERNING FACTOR-like protein 8 [Bidens hawaiensis]|uniref:EPIDERMAL PATTERNING FACTOR-like protein 8 n=1 Tax=Bidens hawaiensis TaxID=980011 RepID=UPI00404A44CD
MAPARTYLLGIKLLTFTAIFLLFLTVSHAISGVNDEGVTSVGKNKKILGSRPPRCVNKCVNCRPCEATLVIPPHYKTVRYRDQSHWDDNYYLLSWKCKCGDKLFQP